MTQIMTAAEMTDGQIENAQILAALAGGYAC